MDQMDASQALEAAKKLGIPICRFQSYVSQSSSLELKLLSHAGEDSPALTASPQSER